MPSLPRPWQTALRAAATLAVVAVLLVAAYYMPLPSAVRVREWADALGPGFVLLFFVAYTVITVGPIPRTTFTVLSGFLFGPIVGVVGSLIATNIAAAVAFWLARRLGRDRVEHLLRSDLLAPIDRRLARRGWLAVGSLRLIAVCPFAVANYASGLSSVHFRHYFLATAICTMPGTIAVAVLGDALAGTTSPTQLALSFGLSAVGVVGLVVDLRLQAREERRNGETAASEA